MNPQTVYLGSLGERFDRHPEPERFEPGDEALLEASGVPLVEVIMTQVVVGGPLLQEVVSDDQDAMGHGHEGFFLAPPSGEPMVLRAEVAPGATGRPRGLRERGPEPLAPFPGLAGLPFPRAPIVAGTHPGPGGAVAIGGEQRHVHAQYYHRCATHLSLAMDCPEARPVQPSDQRAVVAFPEVGGLHHYYARVAA